MIPSTEVTEEASGSFTPSALIPALAVLVAVASIAVLWCLGTGSDLNSLLGILGVRAIEPHFVDLRNIVAAAECAELGYDPLETNPCDQMNRPMNYPRIWLHFGGFIGSIGRVQLTGVMIGVTYVSAVLVTLARYGGASSLLVGILLVSPASVLGIERANIDLMLVAFLLLTYAVAFAGSRIRVSLVAFGLAIASILKYWPLFGSVSLVRSPDKRRVIGGLVAIGVVMLVYTGLTWPDLLSIGSAVPTGCWAAYGWSVPFLCAEEVFGTSASLAGWPRYGLGAAGLIACLGLGAMIVKHIDDPFEIRDNFAGAVFFLGSGVFLGTFLLGANWDYRLVLLVCCVPQLVYWSESPSRGVKRTARIAVGLIVVRMWTSVSTGTLGSLVLVKTLALLSSLLLFSVLAALLARAVTHEWSWSPGSPSRR